MSDTADTRAYGPIMRKLFGPSVDASVGTRLGKYVLRRPLARGGMGTVFEAEDLELRRRVALKILREDDPDPNLASRLHREAAIAAQLRHPNIIAVHDVGVVADPPDRVVHFIAMDLVEGGTLADRLASGKTDRTALLRMMEDVGHAVGHAHSKGVVHRDLKPANVLVEPNGRVVLTDFGLARGGVFHSRLTASQTLLGTPAYMAPEQVEGRHDKIDARTDVYALGVMLYEILTGTAPFASDTPAKLFSMILHSDPRRPRRLCPTLEAELESICLKAMDKDRRRRYSDGKAFAEDLARFQRGEPVQARPPSWFYRMRRVLGRRRVLAICGGNAVLLILALLLGVLLPRHAEQQRIRREKEATLRARGDAQVFVEAGRGHLDQVRARLRDEASSEAEILELVHAAQREFEKALALCGDHPDAFLGLAQAHLLAGDTARALDSLNRCAGLAPESTAVHLERARILVLEAERLRHPDDTAPLEVSATLRSDLELVRRFSRDPSEKKCAEALQAFSHRDFVRAETLLGEYVASNPQDGAARFFRADALFHSARFSDAEEESTRALADDVRNPHLLGLRARARAERRRFPEAIEDASRALRRRSDLVDALWARGRSHQGCGRADAALVDFTQVLSLRPGFSEGFVERAQCRKAKGDRAGAAADCSRAIDLNGRSPKAHNVRSMCRRGLGNIEGAIADATRAIELDPNYAAAYVNRAAAGLHRGSYPQVVADCTRALELDSRLSDAYVNRARARLNLGVFDGAIQDCTDALKLDPKLAEAYVTRAQARERAGDPSGACDDARRALRFDLQFPADRKAMEELLARLGPKE